MRIGIEFMASALSLVRSLGFCTAISKFLQSNFPAELQLLSLNWCVIK